MPIDVELDKLLNQNMEKLYKTELFKLCEINGIIKYKSKNKKELIELLKSRVYMNTNITNMSK